MLYDRLSGKFNAPKLLSKHSINTFKSLGFDKEVVKKFKNLSINPLIWNKDFENEILDRDLDKKDVIKKGIAEQNKIYATMKKNIKKNKKNIKKMEAALEVMSRQKSVADKEITEVINNLKLNKENFKKITHMNVNSDEDLKKYVRWWIIQKKMHDYLMYKILKLK